MRNFVQQGRTGQAVQEAPLEIFVLVKKQTNKKQKIKNKCMKRNDTELFHIPIGKK